MRFHEINEAIENRPRNLSLFLKNRAKELFQIQAELDEAISLVKENEREGERMLRSWLGYVGYENPYETINTSISVCNKYRLERDMPIERLLESIRSYLQYGKDFWRYIMGCFTYMEPLPELSDFKNAELGAIEWGFSKNDPENLQDEEYVAAMNLIKGFRKLKFALDNGKKVCDLMKKKMTVVNQIRNSYFDNYRPEHDEKETLYHATAFCNEILENGFSMEKPIERVGLGNFGEQSEISFTHDVEIARNIMRCFKEIWYIAHGELSARNIIRWGQAEGIDEQLAKQHGGYPGFQWVKTPEDIVLLYSYYLAHSKIRVNPVFIGAKRLIEIMKDRDLKDIGVLACVVKLEQTDEYRIGEAEFRLPPDRVQSIKRIF